MMFPNPVRRSFLFAARPGAKRDIPPGLRDYAACALAGLIAEARQQAIADGVRPIPGTASRALLGYFPEALLRKCRFAVGEAQPLKLSSVRLSYGDPSAITLGDVVVFRSDRAAQTDLQAWAHALTHVMQYQRWGLEDFAQRYVRDSAALEQEAAGNAARFMAWSRDKDAMACC